MAEYFRDGILKDGASRYPALELAARPSSAVSFAARGAGGSRKRQRLRKLTPNNHTTSAQQNPP